MKILVVAMSVRERSSVKEELSVGRIGLSSTSAHLQIDVAASLEIADKKCEQDRHDCVVYVNIPKGEVRKSSETRQCFISWTFEEGADALRQELKKCLQDFSFALRQNSETLEANRQPQAAKPSFGKSKKMRLPELGLSSGQFGAIAIGSSTGGPDALRTLFQAWKIPPQVPVFLVQHIPAGFSAQLAKSLTQVSSFPVLEAVHGEQPLAGVCYLAPGDVHLRLKRNADRGSTMMLESGPLINSVRPALDPLFTDLAQSFSRPICAIVLTGMGEDGLVGCAEIAKNGGLVLTQTESSCVVYGMPRAVDEAQLSAASGTPSELGAFLSTQLSLLKVKGVS